ncbi:hypothetical protein CYLTODRAFT_118007 [Cylindrobasidium torrendii FP15055 ss-10]|uniref:Nuclear pore complex protein NUP96 C-terminal domain-containing protein n=1 Tax=Cylindrobasidium torrendii FP15055 ss-10 TaxID=1314674 RepID=A0A0D7BMZ4_9AGAR|nr:hypothetical protein CYLTODRAFT_118007 [Cylindrobasidium torrendii FP15055 ss-10]
MARFGLVDSEDESESDVFPDVRPVAVGRQNPARDEVDEDMEDEEEQEEEEYDEEEDDAERDQGSEDEHSENDFMDEDELQPRPSRNRLVLDDDGEFEVAGPSNGVPFSNGFAASGRMRVMQTSLFRMPEEANNMRAMLVDEDAPNPLVTRLKVTRKHSRDSDGEGMGMRLDSRTSFAHDNISYRPSKKYARVATASSAFTGHDGAAVDAGLFYGQAFRVGWGPASTYCHLSPGETAASTTVHLTKKYAYTETEKAKELASTLLQHHLTHTPIEKGNVPSATPSQELTFSSFSALFPTTDHSPEASLFRLGHALFDPVSSKIRSTNVDDYSRTRLEHIARKATLSKWLQYAVQPTIENLLRAPGITATEKVWLLLTGNQVERACETAMDAGYIKLATLVAQAGGDYETQADLEEQLDIWERDGITAHIDKFTVRIYALLGGRQVDTGLEGDWKRAFGCHMWFSEPLDLPLADVFKSFTKPPADADPSFALLKLFADPGCSLTKVLEPRGQDYTLTWHLYVVLSRVLEIRHFVDREAVNFLSEDGDEVSDTHTADQLTVTYAVQLEQLGLIQEAVFVLLHLPAPERSIKELLARTAPFIDDWVKSGLLGSLKIPQAWVLESQAILALGEGRVYDSYKLYLDARMWKEAHDIACRELAGEAIIRRDVECLRELFNRFPSNHEKVEGWTFRGQIFANYADIVGDVEGTSQEILAKRAADLMLLLPDAVFDKVVLDEMTRQLVRVVDKAKTGRGVNLSSVHFSLIDSPSRIHHIKTVGVKRFLKSVASAA